MSDKPPGWTPVRMIAVPVLLALPFIGTLWVGSYARTGPTFIGFPFFYWYQMAWVIISSVCTVLAYRLVLRAERERRAARGARETGPAGEEGDAK